jgi:hypothetical protein
MVLIPRCGTCGTAVTDEDGRELIVDSRLLSDAARQRLTEQGWQVTPGDPKLNRGPADPIAGDRLVCPACCASHRDAADAERRRMEADFARPRTRTVDAAAKLGEGWTLTQRAGDADRHRWLVEHEGTVKGMVQRYKRVDGTFSTGWEAHIVSGARFWRRDAISSAEHRPGSSFLWSGRDLAAWGVACNPAHGAARPEWARRRKAGA